MLLLCRDIWSQLGLSFTLPGLWCSDHLLCFHPLPTLLGPEPTSATVTSCAFPEAVCTWKDPAQPKGFVGRGAGLLQAGPQMGLRLRFHLWPAPSPFLSRPNQEQSGNCRLYIGLIGDRGWSHSSYWGTCHKCRNSVLRSHHRLSRGWQPMAHMLDFAHGPSLFRRWECFLHFKWGRRRGGGEGERKSWREEEEDEKTEIIVAHKA